MQVVAGRFEGRFCGSLPPLAMARTFSPHMQILMHGKDWEGEDVSGWFLSEKLDGFRCLWMGVRSGRVKAWSSGRRNGFTKGCRKLRWTAGGAR